MPSFHITCGDDWAALRERKLRAVVDPIIFRTAELFLAGAKDAADPEATWKTIERHLGALFVFFDLVIREDEVPIFDYNESYRKPDEPPWNPELFRGRPNDPAFLVEVHVDQRAWDEAHEAALEILASEPDPSDEAAANVLRSMQQLDYCWVPIGVPETADAKRDAITVIRYGGLLSSLYAEQLTEPGASADQAAEHLIPPLRSSLYLASTLPGPPRGHFDEEKLFAALVNAAKHPDAKSLKALVDIPPTPTFLPYLLSEKPSPATPHELLIAAFDARASKPVESYRKWRKQLAKDAAYGQLGVGRRQEIEDIAKTVSPDDEATSAATSEITWQGGWQGPLPSFMLGGVVSKGLIGWIADHLPGRGHRRTLVRMAHATQRYNDIALKLRSVWLGAAS
jgi:hypothetical protein